MKVQASAMIAGMLLFAAISSWAGEPPILPPQPASKAVAAQRKRPKPLPSISRNAPVIVEQNFVNDSAVVSRELDTLIRDALKVNPDLIAKRAETRAQYDRIAPAGMPNDPSLGFQLKDLPTTFSFTRENATQKQIIVQASYPFPGKLTLRRNVATKQAELTFEELHAQMQHLVTQLRSAFADVFVADKDLQVESERRARLASFVDIATAKYRVGPGLQQDVLNADEAVASSDTRLIDLQRKRLSREVAVAALLDRDAVKIPPLGAPPQLELKQSESGLERIALATNPEILRQNKAVERDQQALDLARKSALPDFAVQLMYGSRNDFTHPETGKPDTVRPDLMRGQIMMTVPVFYYEKQREEIDAAAANLARSRARLAAIRRTVLDGLHDLFARLSEHQRVAESYRDEVIPLAQTAVAASVSAYQVDKVDFLTMLAAQDKLDENRAQYWRERAEVFRDTALIEELAGTVLANGRLNP